MEGQIRLGSRRTRFIDDDQLGNSTDDDASRIFQTASETPVFAVLHDAVPDLGHHSKASRVRIAEPSPTLANLTAEFNDLSQKMTLLKETIKATRCGSSSKKAGPMQMNSSSQALQAGNIIGIATAKLVVHDCIAELTSINHFLDGNEEIATVYREKLRHAIANEYGKAENIVIQGMSLAPNIDKQMPRVGNTTTDSAIGASDHFLSRYARKEAEVQTEAVQTDIIEGSTVKIVTKSSDTNASSKSIGDTSQQSKRAARKKSGKWYSGCGCCTRKKKSNENTEATSLKTSSTMKNRPVKS